MFSFFLIAFNFWEKECFSLPFWTTSFFSLLTNLFSSFTFFSSCFSPLVCLRLWFFFLKKKKTSVFHLPFSFPFFQFEFFVFLFWTQVFSCSIFPSFWVQVVFDFSFFFQKKIFGRFLHLHFSASWTKKKPSFLKRLIIFCDALKKTLDFRKCFWYSIVFHISFVFNSCISYFLLLLRLKEYLFFERFFGWSSLFFSVSWLFFFSSFIHSRCFVSFFVNLPFWSLRYFVLNNTCVVFVTLCIFHFSFILLSSFFCFHLFKSSFCCFFILPFSFPSGKYFLVPIFFTVLSNVLSFLFSLFFFISFFPISCFFACSFHFCVFFFFLSFVSPFSFPYFFLVFFSFFSFLSQCLFFTLSLVFWISFFFFWSFLYLVFSWFLLFLISFLSTSFFSTCFLHLHID